MSKFNSYIIFLNIPKKNNNIYFYIIKNKFYIQYNNNIVDKITFNLHIFIKSYYIKDMGWIFFIKKKKLNNFNLINFLINLSRKIYTIFFFLKTYLKFFGMGYKIEQINSTKINLKLGFSHLLHVTIPNTVYLKILTKQKIKIWSTNLAKIIYFIFLIQSCRFPFLYKKKGIFQKRQNFLIKKSTKVISEERSKQQYFV